MLCIAPFHHSESLILTSFFYQNKYGTYTCKSLYKVSLINQRVSSLPGVTAFTSMKDDRIEKMKEEGNRLRSEDYRQYNHCHFHC